MSNFYSEIHLVLKEKKLGALFIDVSIVKDGR